MLELQSRGLYAQERINAVLPSTTFALDYCIELDRSRKVALLPALTVQTQGTDLRGSKETYTTRTLRSQTPLVQDY